jgi:demethylmenaquinone methyltransferase/2-methoxy-6-polyprenyl-1,4-benzoquinol methylase
VRSKGFREGQMTSQFERIAERYDSIFRYGGPERLLDALQPQHGDRVLDVGGGTGRVSATFGDHLNVVVCDPTPGMLDEARLKGLHVCACVAEHLPFRDGSYPRIIVVDTFHHLEDQRLATAELLRVLQPDGRLVVEEPDIHKPVVKVAALLERLLRVRSRFFSPADMAGIFAASGGHIAYVEDDPGTNVRLIITR